MKVEYRKVPSQVTSEIELELSNPRLMDFENQCPTRICHIPVSRTQYQDYNYDFTRFFYWTTTPYEYLMTFIRITYIIRLILIPNSLAETVNPLPVSGKRITRRKGSDPGSQMKFYLAEYLGHV